MTETSSTNSTLSSGTEKSWRPTPEKGEEFLKAAISVDEGASYFGEVAAVPYDSPISNQKILFTIPCL